MGLIGRGWKLCEGWSRPVLIGRGLAHTSTTLVSGFVVRIHYARLSTQPVWLSLNMRYTTCVVGGCGGGGTPGPIPNPEAKPSSADGTALGRVWESRSPPTFNLEYERGPAQAGPLFHLWARACSRTPP